MSLDRRDFLARSAAAAAAAASGTLLRTGRRAAGAIRLPRALVSITLDLEMSRNFPTWETTHWDYEKGNLDEATKRYAEQAAERVAAAGGRIQFFVVGRVLEQPDVGWLQRIAAAGHPLGNHTYDHVNVTAQRPEEIQFRFQRAPWLIDGLQPEQVIAHNIRLCSEAMRTRLAIDQPSGFRTPGGFPRGLLDHPGVRQELLRQGFKWVSSQYAPHANTAAGVEPNQEVLQSILAAQAASQPFRYDDGLLEIPMSPISDIGAFRTGRWQLPWFQSVIRECVDWAIEQRAVFDFLAHPSCLGVVDPDLKVIDMICEQVRRAGDRAELASLETVAQQWLSS
jgi:hypothetical protein